MVKIAVAGGSGGKALHGLYLCSIVLAHTLSEVAREIVDALVASKNHEIILLTRKVAESL